MKKIVNNSKGFTLVELLVVIVILGIVSSIAMTSIGGILENSKKDAHVANAIILVNAAKLYQASTANAEKEMYYVVAGGVLNDYVDNLTDPWKRENYRPQPGVRIDDEGEYRVTIDNENVPNDCKIIDVPEKILLQGRKVACNYND